MIKKQLLNKQSNSYSLWKLITLFWAAVSILSCSVSPRQVDDSPQSWQTFDQKFMVLAEKRSFLAAEIVEQDCTTIHAIDPEQSLAVGSSFKLYILAELAHQIATQNIPIENASRDGETYLSWDTLLAIQPEYKSIPGGALLFVPDNTQYTVRYFAEQMIQRIDNTATDHLLYLLGRENVEQRMRLAGHHDPALNIPLLATREFVALKFLYSDAELTAYLAKSTANKRLVLDNELRGYQELESYFLQNGEQSAPLHINTIEWFANRFDMCHVLMSLYSTAKAENMRPVTEIMSLEDKLDIDREQWVYVGFKGGSEFGVLAGNWLLQRNDGRLFVISFALNNEPGAIETQSVIPVLKSAVELLERTP